MSSTAKKPRRSPPADGAAPQSPRKLVSPPPDAKATAPRGRRRKEPAADAPAADAPAPTKAEKKRTSAAAENDDATPTKAEKKRTSAAAENDDAASTKAEKKRTSAAAKDDDAAPTKAEKKRTSAAAEDAMPPTPKPERKRAGGAAESAPAAAPKAERKRVSATAEDAPPATPKAERKRVSATAENVPPAAPKPEKKPPSAAADEGTTRRRKAADPPSDSPVVRFKASDSRHFLSNFYPSPFTVDGATYPTAEHFYQYMRFAGSDPDHAAAIAATPSAAAAARLAASKGHPAAPRWDERPAGSKLTLKEQVMQRALLAKFADPQLRAMLFETGNFALICAAEKDGFWGEGDGSGLNRLGTLLGSVRASLRASAAGVA